MRRYRRAGFIALVIAGLAALVNLLGATPLLELPGSLNTFMAAAVVWLIGLALYALRHSDYLAKRTIQKLEHSAIMRLERMARASEPGESVDYMYLKTRLDEEQARIDRHGGVLSLLYVSVNELTQAQEEFGQQVADQVLEETNEIITSHLRQYDALGKLSGNEFLIMLPHTNRRDAREVADSICAAAAEYSFKLPGGGSVDFISLAVGLSAYPLNGESTEAAVNAARKAMESVKAGAGSGVAVSEEFVSSGPSGPKVSSEGEAQKR